MSGFVRTVVLAIGRLDDGFEFVGPFDMTEDAVDFGEKHLKYYNWHVVQLKTPAAEAREREEEAREHAERDRKMTEEIARYEAEDQLAS